GRSPKAHSRRGWARAPSLRFGWWTSSRRIGSRCIRTLSYQHAATERYCEDLPAECAETAHLQGLVATAADAARAKDGRLVIPALFAYALHLEDRLKLGEAFDVLETLLAAGGDRARASDAITTRLRMARVLRKRNEFDAAERLYAEGG